MIVVRGRKQCFLLVFWLYLVYLGAPDIRLTLPMNCWHKKGDAKDILKGGETDFVIVWI